MKEDLEKSREIIVENQRNADSKANIFIILLSGFIAFIGKIPLNVSNNEELLSAQLVYFVMFLPLILFILSLIPVYNQNFKIKIKTKEKLELNIYYWKSIAIYNSFELLVNAFKEKYGISSLTTIEIDLLNQIYVNSMILEHKNSAQRFAFVIIIQFLLLFISSSISFFFFKSNVIIAVGLFVLLDVMSYFNRPLLSLGNKLWGQVRSLFQSK